MTTYAPFAFTSDGVTAQKSVPWPYGDIDEVSLLVGGEPYGGALTAISASIVSMSPVPANGLACVLIRETSEAEPEHTFQGGPIGSADLNRNHRQHQYRLQELGADILRAIKKPFGETSKDLPKASLRRNTLAYFEDTLAADMVGLSQAAALLLFQGSPGGNTQAIGLWSAFTGFTIPVGTDQVRTSGYSVTGRGAAYYTLDPDQVTATATATRKKSANNRWFILDPAQMLNVHMFGALADGTTNDGPSIQAALNYAQGCPMYAPAGTYKVSTAITYTPATFPSGFGPGVRLYGAGMAVTYFDNQVANGAMLSIVAGTYDGLHFILGAYLEEFSVKTTTSPVASSAIVLRGVYNTRIRQVSIAGMSLDGIRVEVKLGDYDAANMLSLEHLRIENCGGWGINTKCDSGFNELSFLHLKHVFIQNCGTLSAAAPPTTGGMVWKGQICTLDQCAFTLNKNVALYVPGESGLAQTLTIRGTAFENNNKRSLYVTGLYIFEASNIQFYANDAAAATVMCGFEASVAIRKVDISNVTVRVTSGNNTAVAFKLSGVTPIDVSSCRVRNVNWENFDYAGQTRFDGWQFDPIACGAQLVAEASTTLVLKSYTGDGLTYPIRRRGPANQGGVGVPATAGEWELCTVVAAIVQTTGLAALGQAAVDLVASTNYYCYVYDRAGVPTLFLTTAVPVLDAATGYEVQTGDSSKFFVGGVSTTAGNVFSTAGNGWFKPLRVPASQLPGYAWMDATTDLRKSTARPTSDLSGAVAGTDT